MDDKFVQIKSNLITDDISDSSFRILCYLIMCSKNNLCFPSQNTIANDLRMSKPTVIKGTKELEDRKIIIKELRNKENGKKTTNCYYIGEQFTVKKKKQKKVSNAIYQASRVPEDNQKADSEILDYDWLRDESEE